MKNIPIGEVLKEYGYITDEQIKRALEYQKTEEGRNERLGDVLLKLGFVTESQILQALANKLGLKVIDLDLIKVDLSAVERVPKALAAKYNMLPVAVSANRLVIATSDPLNFYAQEDIKQVCDMNLLITLCESAKVKSAIEYYYNEVNARIAARQANVAAEEFVVPAMEEGDDDEAPVIKLLNTLLARGYSTNASDIHIEPFENFTTVRMRIDGMILDYVTLEKSLHNSVIARIKILSDMDIAEKRVPQDGNLRITAEGYDIAMRVSVIPTVYGEKAVLRYLTSSVIIDNSSMYGMEKRNFDYMNRMLKAPNGIIYITGPTGSGKTTTLYEIIQRLSQGNVNISTIEDPVERTIAKVIQTNVNTAAGLTFERGLRAILRQDPDIIMVGETRDNETAEISVRAAITGHLVLSTLHTNDALSSIVRLEDMGIKTYLVANSLVGIVAQRLVRKVCANCCYDTVPTAEEKAFLGDGIEVVRKANGCNICNHTGYKGRTAIHEMIIIDKELKRMIVSGADIEDMREYAVRKQGMTPLGESAVDLVRKKITTPEEALKVAYYSD